MPARDSRGRFKKGGGARSMAKRGGTTALARRGGGSVVVVRSSSPAKAAKKGGGRRRKSGGSSGVTTPRKKMFIFGGGAVYGKLRSIAKKEPKSAAAMIDKIPVLKEIGPKLTHGILATWLLVPNLPAGFWREAGDGMACALIGSAGVDFGMSDFDMTKMAALGDDGTVMTPDQVRQRFHIEGE